MTARTAWKCSSLVSAAGLLGACMLHASDARAEPSAWFAVGGGYGLQHSEASGSFDRATVFSVSAGVGTNPLGVVVAGGTVRSTTYFSLGTDLSLSARVATGSFVRGQWGLAFDIGPSWRSWGTAPDVGRFPLQAMLIGGAPFGFQLGVGTQLFDLSGDGNARGVVAVLELDLLRLTVMRQGATDRYWENPVPAGGRPARE